MQSDREDLIALREYVYRSETAAEPVAETRIEEMKAVIAGEAVVIISGYVNWLQKRKQLFTGCLFVPPNAYKAVDGKMLENKEHVYLFMDYLNHVSYVKFVAVVRKKGIPFGYLGCVDWRVFENLGKIRNL